MKLRGCLITLLVLVVVAGAVLLALFDFEISGKNNKVGVIEIKGTITGSQDTLKQIKEYRKDSSIRAILVRIDSPGGAVGPSQEIYRELKRASEVKPVVASMGSVAASGGYYIACAANHVMANPGTITGSIGVIIHFPNLRELFDKIGYQMTTIKSGQFKDLGNPGREMTPEEEAVLQGMIDETYGQFVRDVSSARKLPEDDVRKIADGRIFVGEKARELKLIDQLGNFEDAVDKAAELGKIEGEPDVVYAKKSRKALVDFLFGSELSEKLQDMVFDSAAILRYQLPDLGR
ncbi:MAG: signal peptide peptidase SppA [Desulfobacteraceae bacterium]|nr:signal peptide peptidase SppA [Desulfobacteraceae bacterium]